MCGVSLRFFRLWKGGARKLGVFVNPSNSAFQVALNSKIYVDKSGLLEYTNNVFGTTEDIIKILPR